MKICFAYSNHHLAETTAQPGIAYKLALKAKEAGHRVTIVSNVREKYVGKKTDGIFYFLFPGQGNLQTYLQHFLLIVIFLWRENPEVIHVHGNLYFVYLLLIGRLVRKKVTVYVSETVEIHSLLFKRIFLTSLRFAGKIFVSCEAIKAELLEKGIDPKRIMVIRIGLDEKFYKSITTKKNIDVLYFGDSTKARGFDVFVKSARVLSKYSFVGLLRYYQTDCRDEFELARNLSNLQMRFYPYREPIEEIIARAKIIFLPFRSMGVRPPVTILEAMASGSCTITTGLPGNSEIITNGKDGFIVDPDNLKNALELIESLLRDDKRREEIARQGRLKVKRLYGKREYEKLIENL